MGVLWVFWGSQALQSQQCPGNHTSDTVHSQNYLFSIRNNKFEYRCSKTGTSKEKLIRGRLFIKAEARAEKGRDRDG